MLTLRDTARTKQTIDARADYDPEISGRSIRKIRETEMRMTIIRGVLFAAAATLFLHGTPSLAQDEQNGPMTWGEDAQYDQVVFIKFKPGKRERAMQIIDEYFVPASEKAGTSEPIYVEHFQTGEWDMLLVWHLQGGTADLKWYRSADDIKWFNALAELNGGQEAAQKLWDEFSSAIADSVTQLGHHHTGMTK
jgi:hypothetical protein